MVKIGFTGNRLGLSYLQASALTQTLMKYPVGEFHHGNCIGSDDMAHQIVLKMFGKDVIYIHPPINTKLERQDSIVEFNVLPAESYLKRNHSIVDATRILIATPGEFSEVLRSGTWATIRYARQRSKQVIIIFPDGSLGA